MVGVCVFVVYPVAVLHYCVHEGGAASTARDRERHDKEVKDHSVG